MTAYFEFREQWLAAAVDEVRDTFARVGCELPKDIKVSCGFPVGSRGGKKIMGQCFAPSASKSGATEIFISPALDNALEVYGVLMHELCHAADGNIHGHGREFVSIAKSVGLTGKATEMLPGDTLRFLLKDLIAKFLGEYPHASVDFSQRKKQSTRMIKLVCPVTGYTVRTTQKWLDKGLPMSPAGHIMEPRG